MSSSGRLNEQELIHNVDLPNKNHNVAAFLSFLMLLYSSLFTIFGRQLKHTEMNRQRQIRQTKYTKLLQKTYLCTYATYFTYTGLYMYSYLTVPVIIISLQ